MRADLDEPDCLDGSKMEDINMSNIKSNGKDFDRDKWSYKNPKVQVFSLVSAVILGFLLGWVFLIPAIAVVALVYGGVVYFRERKNRIVVRMKTTPAKEAIASREVTLAKEKEILYEEMNKSTFR
jgi:hypothetical protein